MFGVFIDDDTTHADYRTVWIVFTDATGFGRVDVLVEKFNGFMGHNRINDAGISGGANGSIDLSTQPNYVSVIQGNRYLNSWINGTPNVTIDFENYAPVSPDTAYLGSYHPAPSFTFYGKMMAVAFAPSALSDPDRIAVETALKNRYGL
jgi:hypothetical protein